MTKIELHSGDVAWIAEWLHLVKLGELAMSQRALISIEAHGGLEAAIKAARANGLHLVQLTDDNGKVLVAASKESFTTFC